MCAKLHASYALCLTSLMCRRALRDHLLYVPACLRFFRAFLFDEPYVPSFFMCFTCLHFLRAFCASIILRALRVYFFYFASSALHHPHSQWHFWLFKWERQSDSFCESTRWLFKWSDEIYQFRQGIRTMSLQCCYNIFDVETALQQPYYSQLWHADCHYADFNWSLRQGIILVKVLRTRLYSSSFSRWFREVFRSGWHVIYNNILHVKYTPLSNNFLKYIAKKSPNQLFNKNVCVLGCSITYKKARQGKRHERHVRNWKHLKKWKHVRHVKEWRHVRHINKWGGVNKESA